MACQTKSTANPADNNGEMSCKHAWLQTEWLFSARGLEPSKIQHLAADDGGLGSRNRNLYLGNIRKPIFGKKMFFVSLMKKCVSKDIIGWEMLKTFSLQCKMWLLDDYQTVTGKKMTKCTCAKALPNRLLPTQSLQFTAFPLCFFPQLPGKYLTVTHKPFNVKIYTMLLSLAWVSGRRALVQ